MTVRPIRSLLALLVLGVHLWLAPFAFADPPDPIEMGGIFDDGDADDIVLAVMALHGVVDTAPPIEDPPQPVVLLDVVLALPVSRSTPPRRAEIRAPPLA